MGELDLCRVRGGYQTSRQGVHQAGPASTPLGGDHGAQCSRVALVQRGGGGGGGDRHRGLPNSSEAVNYVLEHSRADILVVGDSENLAKLSDTGTKLAAADKYALQGSLIETLVEAQPTRFIGVPRVYEKIADKLQEVAAKGGRSPTTCTLCTTTIAHLLQVVKDNDQLAEKERTLYLNIF